MQSITNGIPNIDTMKYQNIVQII